MPPEPFNTFDSRVVAILNAASFSILSNISKVKKRDTFTKTYMPSTTSRTCSNIVKRLISSLTTLRITSLTLPVSKRILVEHYFGDVGSIWFNRSMAIKDREIVAKISFVNGLDYDL